MKGPKEGETWVKEAPVTENASRPWKPQTPKKWREMFAIVVLTLT